MLIYMILLLLLLGKKTVTFEKSAHIDRLILAQNEPVLYSSMYKTDL
jgi:hypothetical protein